MNERYQRDQDQLGWRQGISKRHKIPCQQCGGLQHVRGHHFRPEQLGHLLQAERERQRERAAARAKRAAAVAAD